MNSLKKIFRLLYQLIRLIFYGIKVLFKTLPHFFTGMGQILHVVGKIFKGARQRIRRLFRFSITFKITVVYAFIISLLLLLSNASILLGFRFFLLEQLGKDIERNSQFILTDYMDDTGQIPQEKIANLAKQENLQVHIFDGKNEIIYTTNNDANNLQLIRQLDTPIVLDQRDSQSMILTKSVSINDEDFFLQVEKNMQTENTYIQILALVLLIVNGVGAIIILIIGSRISRRMLKPIETMTETVKNITIYDLNRRLDVRGSQDELKELAETFNEMFDGIQSSYDRQNQFVSDASHELRTPIAVIQGYANLLDRWGKDDKAVLEESIVAIKGEAENMQSLMEKLLFLARSDKGLQKLEIEEFVLNDLMHEVAKETRLIDTVHDIQYISKEMIVIQADRKTLKQALRIFIDNSAKFTPPDGIIRLETYLQKKHIVIVIEDTGAGIPKEDIPHIFDRFYRSDKSRTKASGGHGLGLSIAKLIIDRHKGRIEVESTVQVGTKIRIYLPVSQVKK
ncbi:signal transduction histidine kinase [Anaerosolibacter carboniphilus]|uniref:histidine kinase n=1 Tax=Anaerosolibacter carboniphilus TaxID=1417629 RepID=A0A841KV33_9FIRM|nr:ATP-binding protein [Anaerosolibacter carboniphilus]MBB6214035.1 signal transduction histidine kinase [Anaerosolibacter carboniphilus]